MEEIRYIGELLAPRYFGHLALLTGFVGSLLALVAYFFATQRRYAEAEAAQWRQIGRAGFAAHAAGILSLIGILFFLMIKQRYEYQYVWAHVSDELPLKYIFSAFWEGQEGSFLLWLFWHIVLGLVLMFRAGRWEAPVLATLASIQAVIISMILGIYVGWGEWAVKIGSSPLLLLRETMDTPLFNQADYVRLLQGSGLNPLLQNYWMTIHPPTLFLGFASTAIPFAYAVAGLWMGEHKAWLRPALPWALFSGAILGAGILMGGAWAYEALSFGGYWAWDPVENMSLVPWLLLVGGIHAHLIARATGHSIRSAYMLYLLTFIFIVYSTFLTRSGVLGDTSVHAFTEMGLEWQLVGFILLYLGLSTALMIRRYRSIPAPKKEEALASKEFWMFIGVLVLLFSALLITISTSLPVFNKVAQFFDPTFEGRVITDPIPHYNKHQIWIAIFIGILSGAAQYLRFGEHNWRRRRRKFALHTSAALLAALLLTYLASRWINAQAWQYQLLLFAALFTAVANADYLVSFLRGNLKLAGSVFSHLGFGLMIVGILASGLNKRFISMNPFVMDGLIEGADQERLRNNILLFKGESMRMGDYQITYTHDTLDVYTRTYTTEYKRFDEQGRVVESFQLHPNVLYEKDFTKIAASNPSTKRYWNRDIFTHIASLPQVEMDLTLRRQREDSLNYRSYDLAIDQPVQFLDTVPLRNLDSFVVKSYTLRLEEITRAPSHPDYTPAPGDLAAGALLALRRSDEDSVYRVRPVIVLRGQFLYQYPIQINDLSVKVRLNEEVFDRLFLTEEQLDYREFTLHQGDRFDLEGYTVVFSGFNKTPRHPHYQAEEEDIAVSAMLSVRAPSGKQYLAEPVYLIRDSRPFNLKDIVEAEGLHFRFARLDPASESITLLAARARGQEARIPVEVATDSLRSDYIVLEAIEFPGINFFWLGSILLLAGMTLSMFNRMRRSNAPQREEE